METTLTVSIDAALLILKRQGWQVQNEKIIDKDGFFIGTCTDSADSKEVTNLNIDKAFIVNALADKKRAHALELVNTISRMSKSSDGDDCVQTLNYLIDQAKEII